MEFGQNKTVQYVTASLLAVLGFLALTPSSRADVWNQKTRITLNEALEVPGATLQPGKYVIKLADSLSNRHIVRFMNDDESKVFATVLAISNQRMDVTGDTKFTLYEMPAGSNPALRGWFFPGRQIGHEFVYPENRAEQIAGTTGEEVPSMSNEAERYMRDSREDDEYLREYGEQEVGSTRPQSTQQQQAKDRRSARDYSETYSFEEEESVEGTDATQSVQSAQSAQSAARNQSTATTNQSAQSATRDQTTTYGQTQAETSATTTGQQRSQPNYPQDSRAMAQNQQQGQQRPSPYTASNQLPDTASNGPLLALIGLALLAGALATGGGLLASKRF